MCQHCHACDRTQFMSPKKRLHKMQEYLDFATELAQEAGQITLRYFKQGVAVESKADESPVTIADRETELFLREKIAAKFPDHGILGEEYGETNPGARWRWILDPIDGTKAFVSGVPLYTVLIALECSGDSHLGVIHCPPQGETVAAATGYGCFWNGAPCRVSDQTDLARARVTTTDWRNLSKHRPQLCAALLDSTNQALGWGDGFGYMLVATGRADAMIDPQMTLWDAAPLHPIILEAGGQYTDLHGIPSIYTGHTLATNGHLHDALLELTKLD